MKSSADATTFCSFASSILRKPKLSPAACDEDKKSRRRTNYYAEKPKLALEVTIQSRKKERCMKIWESAEYLLTSPSLRSIIHGSVSDSLSRVRERVFLTLRVYQVLATLPTYPCVISVLSSRFKIPLRGGHDSSRCSARSYLHSVFDGVDFFMQSPRGLTNLPLPPFLLGALLLLFRGEVYNASPLVSVPPPSFTYCKYGVVWGELGSPCVGCE